MLECAGLSIGCEKIASNIYIKIIKRLNEILNRMGFVMTKFLSLITRECLFLFFASMFVLFSMSAVYIDVYFIGNSLYENSVTEILQEILLANIVGMFFWSAIKQAKFRGGLILIGGFYLCMLIRELDVIFDMLWHGSWIWFALATAGTCIVFSVLKSKSTIAGLTDFIRHRSWLMTATGLIIILIFSRLIGMHQLWQHLMLDGYNRVVKNMAEEACELLGYSVCFLSSVVYLRETHKKFTDRKMM